MPRFSLCVTASFLIAAFCLSPRLQADPLDARPAGAQSDRAPFIDPMRPISEIGPNYAVFQWYTKTPCPTRLQVREGNLPVAVWHPQGQKPDLWAGANVRIIEGTNDSRTYHELRVTGLKPGRRYFYRLFDPQSRPTAQEETWGAVPPWRREWAVSTQGGKGKKTIIRVPIKVLLMPNVVNIASARKPDGTYLPLPTPLSPADITRIKNEYAETSRFLFLNSGMRYFADFQIFVDDRLQRWGDEPSDAPSAYRGLPVCRSYAGKDFDPPGGGTWTILDTQNVARVTSDPVVEAFPYPGQIEQAFPRRYNAARGTWEFYTSGGGTFGVDTLPTGVPARSQFLGGGDTAWLAAHEFHHQMEGQSALSLSNREDDRIVFDHPAPRRAPNDTDGGQAWNTAGRHGEHWDVLAFWDRTLTDAQWLRSYFGETITTNDADGDGVPDDDPRLPIDEKRLGSDKGKTATDGQMNDLAKAMLSTGIPAPLQPTWIKPADAQYARPNFRTVDTDGDGWPDSTDPYPFVPYAPFVWPATMTLDGNRNEWRNVPLSGRKEIGGMLVTYQQAHDEDAYYGLITVKGPWRSFSLTLDGGGNGVYSGPGVHGIRFTWAQDVPVLGTDFDPPLGFKATQSKEADGTTVFEFALPNRMREKVADWFWERGGREIGSALDVTAETGAVYSLWEPYHLFYARMLESSGRDPLPVASAPAELTRERATRTILPGSDASLKLHGEGWTKEGDTLRHAGANEATAFVSVPPVTEFEVWMRFEARQDGILATFTTDTSEDQVGAGRDYVAFVGGYANTVARFRLFGRENGDEKVALTPGEHTMQLTRRNGALWCLLDGKPLLYARDPDPKKPIDKIAVIGGYTGAQVIKEMRLRY